MSLIATSPRLGRTDAYAAVVQIEEPIPGPANRFTPLAHIIREHATRGATFPVSGDFTAHMVRGQD